ncbi:hypothetical protein Y1Q_0011581 [Alligator mississippiensis]|uniref:Uncharacterized protein n=1 Tax=Alligator mississippiensis TaxID=8496 RepID=A0A151M0D4_ALLMI|nr:hypothetical protein Y1Q_0011581 [Alligator mississippiensis]
MGNEALFKEGEGPLWTGREGGVGTHGSTTVVPPGAEDLDPDLDPPVKSQETKNIKSFSMNHDENLEENCKVSPSTVKYEKTFFYCVSK